MKTIKFVLDTVFEQFGPNHPDNPRFAVDQVEKMRNDQADRWLKREKAELVEDHGPDELVIEGVSAEVIAEVRDQVEQRVEQEQAAETDVEEKAVEELEQTTARLDEALGDDAPPQTGRGR